MAPETRSLRPFLFLFAGMVAWWFAPAAFRRAVYRGVYQFEAPAVVLSSKMRDLGLYWEMRSRGKDDLIRAVRDASRESAGTSWAIARNEALEAENRRLEKMLGLPERPEYRSVSARVAQRRLGMWWQQILLRRGEDSGIRVGCPVVDASGVVGRVREVFYDTCVVELVSSPAFRISANIAGSGIRCPVTYQGAGAQPFRSPRGKIYDVPAGVVIPEDAGEIEVETSGLGGIFPAGLKIGRLAGTLAGEGDGIVWEAPVELSRELASIEEVSVLVPVNPDVLETTLSFREQ